ncbi:MAG: hypothetical protein QXV93_05970 [Zestosphaera sp.]
MLLASFKTTVKSLSLITHLSLVVLLALLALVSLSILGLFTSLYNFYDNLLLINGDGLVISSYAVSPLTSVVSEKYVKDLISGVEGVKVEPLVFSLVHVKNKIVVVRGVEKTVFSSFYHGLEDSAHCVLVGEGLAKELNLSEGDTLVLYSPFVKEPVIASVCSVKYLPSLLNYEIIADIEFSRTIRGLGSDYYSVVILRADNLSVLSGISMKMGLSSEDITLLRKALLVLSQQGGVLAYELRSEIPEVYVAKLGIHKDLIFTLSYTVAALVIISDLLIGEHIFRLVRGCIEILRFLGVSKKRIFITLVIQTLAYVAAAVFIAITLLHCLSSLIRLEVLSHYVGPQISFSRDSLFVFSSKTFLLLAGILWGFVRYEK